MEPTAPSSTTVRPRYDSSPQLASVLLPHVLRGLVGLIPVAGAGMFWAVGTGFSILAGLGAVGGRGMDLGPEVDSGLTLIGTVGLVFFGLLWVMLLFVGIREVVAEGGLLVPGGASTGAAVQARVRELLEVHAPDLTLAAGELDGTPVLRVGNGREHALVLARPVGPDLRVGWSVSRSRSTINLVMEMSTGRRNGDFAALQADVGATVTHLVVGAVDRAVSGS